jgi:hypothetical protein
VPADLDEVGVLCCGVWLAAVITSKGKVVCWAGSSHGECEVLPYLEHAVSICFGDCTMAAGNCRTEVMRSSMKFRLICM